MIAHASYTLFKRLKLHSLIFSCDCDCNSSNYDRKPHQSLSPTETKL